MNKKYLFLITVIISILIGGGIYLYNSIKDSNSQTQNYSGYKISSNNSIDISNTNASTSNNTIDISSTNTSTSNNIKDENSTPTEHSEYIETEIASYTTKIRTKDEGRQTNITLTCSTLNNTIVENGSTFSFCDTVGKATEAKGYEEANVFQDGIEVEAVGGGKCQVSSTLYNAVLEISELEVVERHPHSGDVYYVPEGKDAAVAYGSYDFKFKNNTGSSLKIKAENTEDSVTIKILKIE